MPSEINSDSFKLVTISYRSEAQLSDRWHDLVSLLEVSKLRNAASDVTGVLLFDGTYFLQTIEGPSQGTKRIFAKILQDHRHKNIKSFEMQEIEERDFPDWHMELITSDETSRIVADMGSLEFSYRRLREVQAMSVDVMRQRENTIVSPHFSGRSEPFEDDVSGDSIEPIGNA